MTDKELITQAQGGDIEAYTKLMQLHHRTVERFAFQCGVHSTDIPDITQEVFVKIYRFLHQFNQDRFTTWLYKITLNATRDYYRKESREKSKEEKLTKSSARHTYTPSAEERILVFEEDQTLHQAILQLDEKYRYPIVLYYFHELTYEQIAEVLNTPLSTVKTRLLRAKEQLKRVLTTNGGAESGR
ncbi:RNA polymerase sigma factor [Viridibacillus sp. YIM B01967]|uniref:RNA polymerase sigma factor n=1 Tax=Viridibacillus soli TaxID=2798301 RepID=A0ABS1H9W6_9BACL|nr:RNA polymerase sigma factor [Viridibacillus soli]MBK3496198.1 RNA polymerase sigma factor [Viridibacillus soli]